MTGTSWAQASGLSPSGLSLGVAQRLEWPGLAVDVVLGDRQRRACAGDRDGRRRAQMSAQAGGGTRAGVFAAHGVGGASLDAGAPASRSPGLVGTRPQVCVVGLAGELDQLGGHCAHGVLAGSEHGVGSW